MTLIFTPTCVAVMKRGGGTNVSREEACAPTGTELLQVLNASARLPPQTFDQQRNRTKYLQPDAIHLQQHRIMPKRLPGRLKKVPPISPHRIRPTSTSPPPMIERKRGRPPQRVRPPSKTPKRKRAKASVEEGQSYPAKRILDEDKANYLIEWDVINPKTKKPYEPSWHPKACANGELISQWKQDKASKEWSAQGIVAENDHYYKISWEDDPKTGEVYQDTWEPKAFASEAIVRDWELRKADFEYVHGQYFSALKRSL